MLTLAIKEKYFGDKLIFRNIDLRLVSGQVLHIDGKSGSGKTTLTRIIMGLDREFSGKINNDFKNMSVSFPEKRFFKRLSGKNQVKVMLMDKSHSNNIEADIEDAFKDLAMIDSIDRDPSEYSTGMKSRLSLIRALICPSELVILDEPLLGLDEKTRILAINFIHKKLNGRTLIYTGEKLNFNDEIILNIENYS